MILNLQKWMNKLLNKKLLQSYNKPSQKNSSKILNFRTAQKRSRRRNTCINFLATSDLSYLVNTADLFTGGNWKISTLIVIMKAQASLCLKSKTVTASVATLKLSGSQMIAVSGSVIVMQCCLTCLNNVNSLAQEMAKRYTAIVAEGLITVTMS